ncbi:MAG TPA: hypothetical protein VEO54_19785 [Thermoanaerobaculia bacterium]|nr:hypothetical protein [Thermoanaerobaculia bacterium]
MISRRDRARARFAPLFRGRGLEIGALNAPFLFETTLAHLIADAESRSDPRDRNYAHLARSRCRSRRAR